MADSAGETNEIEASDQQPEVVQGTSDRRKPTISQNNNKSDDERNEDADANDEDENDNDDDDDEDNFDDYYTTTDFDYEVSCEQMTSQLKDDPEYFEYEVINKRQLLEHLDQVVDDLCSRLNTNESVSKVGCLGCGVYRAFKCLTNQIVACHTNPADALLVLWPFAQIILQHNKWDVDRIVELNQSDPQKLLTSCRLKSLSSPTHSVCVKGLCDICLQTEVRKHSLDCGHAYCVECWRSHVLVQLQSGSALTIECMAQECRYSLPAEVSMWLLETHPSARRRYEQLAVGECVHANPCLQRCPGADCERFFMVKKALAKRVQCSGCATSCCFRCRLDYHAPTDCATIRQWLAKCADDSETANYISAHTKDCPQCHVCIEKNGGCNHMQCTGCKFEFCWMCLGDWTTHGSEYYECSRFKEQTANAAASVVNQQHVLARKALKKYLFYFERWENHARSLRLEQQTLETIKARIQEKVMKGESFFG
jgi:ariadne-2